MVQEWRAIFNSKTSGSQNENYYSLTCYYLGKLQFVVLIVPWYMILVLVFYLRHREWSMVAFHLRFSSSGHHQKKTSLLCLGTTLFVSLKFVPVGHWAWYASIVRVSFRKICNTTLKVCLDRKFWRERERRKIEGLVSPCLDITWREGKTELENSYFSPS